jgi:UDP-N-acetylmuramoyl-L-alanyl-D-glutamate--2,6-diaminopimelate ligase
MTVGALLQQALAGLAAEGDLEQAARLTGPCAGVAFDSRTVAPGQVFVALKGQRADGAAYAAHAAAAGASAVVAEEPPVAASRVPWVVVSNARLALAHLAAEYFEHPSRDMQVVGITGTNGKTTTAYLVAAIFEAAGVRCGMLGTVEYRLGGTAIPATRTTPEAPELQAFLRRMRDDGCGACAMEVSSHALALRRADAIRFAGAVFTNLTRDHLDFHPSLDDYFAAKRRLFELAGAKAPAVINADDPRCAALLEMAGRPVSYGVARPADVSPGPLNFSFAGLAFDVRAPQGIVHVQSRLVGKPNVYNILAAVGVTAALGVPLEAIEQGLRDLSGVPGRFEVVSSAADDITVVVDYAHTDDALRNLLETARPMAARRLVTVFGAGGDRDRTKRPLMGLVAARLSDVVVITSDNPRSEDPARIIEEVMRGAEPELRQRPVRVVTEVDRAEAIRGAVRDAAAGDLVLVAGKGHEKYQEIGGVGQPFDDVAMARAALAERRAPRTRVG